MKNEKIQSIQHQQRIISFPFVSELFKFPLSPSDSAFSASLWFFNHSDVTGFDIICFSKSKIVMTEPLALTGRLRQRGRG